MKNSLPTLRGRLLLFTAFTLAGSLGLAASTSAQTAPTPVMVPDTSTPTPVIVPGEGTTPNLNAYEIEKVKIEYKKLLLREKDIPNAVTELGQKQVQAENPTTGSIQTLLKQSPSVVAYSQQPGQDNTTLAIRGVSNDQLAETLDGVPINSLLNGSGDYLSAGEIGSPVTLNEIDGVTIYPGLAPPDKQGFGTTGGTIAYTSKQPTDDRYEELEGGFGSFDTQHIGFVINTGKMGDSPDAPKALLLYDQSQTAGYVSNTPAQFHDFMLNVVKPYDNGLSKVGMLIIFNQGKALVQTLPSPVALIQAQGYKFNYPTSLGYYNQADQDLTTILSDETYINKYAIFNASLFFHHNSTTIDNYLPEASAAGYTYNGVSYPPNVQGTYNFFGCVDPNNTPDPDTGQITGVVTYAPADCIAGESDDFTREHSNIIGITPKITLFPDKYNTIVIGALIAKTMGSNADYIYGGTGADSTEIDGYNGFDYGGGQQRTIYSAYAQDTIRLLDGKLQITPGVKVDSAFASHIIQVKYGNIDQQKLENFTKIGGYYLGASYNLPDNFVVYGSAGKGSLFAPVENYSQDLTATGEPVGTNTLTPEIVHLYEGGLRYDTPRLLLNVDYYYQNISDGFAYFNNFVERQEYYSNNGGELYRGVEGNGELRITPALSVFGNFSYNETEYTKSFPGFDTLGQDQFGYAFTGTPLSNVPIWNGLIGAEYDQGPFSAYATGEYTGREFTTDDLDAPPYGNQCYKTGDMSMVISCEPSMVPTGYTLIDANPLDGATVTNQKILNPANFVVNLLLTYKIPVHAPLLKSLTASLNIQNLLDERYYNYTYSSENGVEGVYDPSQPGGMPYNSAFVGEPRSFTVNLVAKF